MNRNIMLATVLITSFIIGGCAISTQSTPTPAQQSSASQQKKNINTTLEGTIVQTATGYAIQTGAPTPIGVDSYEIPIKNYLQQKVRMTGQYSGDTLFVDKVEQLP